MRSSFTMLSKSSSVSRRNAWRRLSSKSGKRARIRADARPGYAGTATARRSSSTSACGARVGQHAPHLLVEHLRPPQRPVERRRQQLLVRDAAPEEERQARRELDVARRGYGVLGATSSGSRSMRKRNSGLARIARNRHFDARLEAILSRSRVAIERQRHFEIGIGHRPPVRAARQRRENRLRAGGFIRAPAGRQTKIRRRLGVSPAPRVSKGPVIDTERTAGCTRGCRSILKCAGYGCRTVSSRANDFRGNVAPTSCGPAAHRGARLSGRVSTASSE